MPGADDTASVTNGATVDLNGDRAVSGLVFGQGGNSTLNDAGDTLWGGPGGLTLGEASRSDNITINPSITLTGDSFIQNLRDTCCQDLDVNGDIDTAGWDLLIS